MRHTALISALGRNQPLIGFKEGRGALPSAQIHHFGRAINISLCLSLTLMTCRQDESGYVGYLPHLATVVTNSLIMPADKQYDVKVF